MALREILILPDKRLRLVSEPVVHGLVFRKPPVLRVTFAAN